MSDSTPGGNSTVPAPPISAPPAATPPSSVPPAPAPPASVRAGRTVTAINPYAAALGLIWVLALVVGTIVILWALSAKSTTGIEWAVFFFGVAALTGLVHLAVKAVRWQAK
jgi:hypothetical protein